MISFLHNKKREGPLIPKQAIAPLIPKNSHPQKSDRPSIQKSDRPPIPKKRSPSASPKV
ncbi:hypothetical protein [Argonema galeatum]|uniref:hypothetical protein n=1 Tax=Argonema galeatum TaxID=2942762 RepID=UPI002011BA4C|nr:hypothetical protein [Argonema galeatum]MCL1464360.1 hypothetical protein [Argonema galeatum A003/A1]